jgi:hypothetical protein
VPLFKIPFWAHIIFPQFCHPFVHFGMGCTIVMFSNLTLWTNCTLTCTSIQHMCSLYAIPQVIQPLSQQIKLNMVLVATYIHVFALFHKIGIHAFKFPLLNLCFRMGNCKQG